MRAALLALLTAAAATAAQKRAPAHDALHTQCLLHSADPKNPWALAHGITAIGKSHVAEDGRRAIDVIVGDFVQKGSDPTSGAWSFARYAKDGTPIEPHTNLIAKTLVLAGVPDSEIFKTPHGKITLGELVKSVERSFRHVPQSEAYWRDAGWTLDLLSARMTPKKATFQNGAGETVDLNAVMDDALGYLELAQKDLAEGMDKGLAEVPKRKQGIYAHPCGGLHLFQAVASWARFPEVRKKWGKRFDRQVAVLFYRLGSEQRQYEAALAQAPQFKLQLLTQMLKFHGHFLETTGRMKAESGWQPDKAQRQTLEKAKVYLDYAVRELRAAEAFEKMDELEKSQPQLHLDLIGDACHAAHGFSYWR